VRWGMKVRCINKQCSRYLVESEIYEPLRTDGEYYIIVFDNWEYMYHKSNFEVVEEVMIIKEWKDLNNKSNDDYYLEFIGTRILVYRITTSILEISIFFEQMPKQKVIELLLHLGFNVKFKELPKISNRLYQICKAYSGWWLAVSEDEHVTISQRKPNRLDGDWKTTSRVNYLTALDIGMTWKDEPINTSEIIRMYEQQNNTNI
jgi:hypothetical protein